ncbi:MAG: hypothetical protein P8010_16915 [Desulfosarcinaceae bacterium]|jgi:hypothetical protein
MTWRIEYDEALSVIRCVYAGTVTAEDFRKGALETIALAKKHNTHRILIDDSKLKSTVSTLEIYEMPGLYEAADANRRSKWALILPPEGSIREDVNFYVTLCLNRGWFVKAFEDRRTAIDWLLGDP